MDIIHRLFEDKAKEARLFTDYGFCAEYGGSRSTSFFGGPHVRQGAKFHDIASITKMLTHLLILKLAAQKKICLEDPLDKYVSVPNANGRKLWHLLAFLDEKHAFYNQYDNFLRGVPSVKKVVMSMGYDDWTKKHHYNNFSSVFLGLVLEKIFGGTLEEIFHAELCLSEETRYLLFHPQLRGVDSRLVVPTGQDESIRGLPHDPIARANAHEQLSIAGIFSTADTVAQVFSRNFDFIMRSPIYNLAASNVLEGVDGGAPPFGLGFDIPLPTRFPGMDLDGPLIFTGHTGSRIFIVRRPRIVVSILTNTTFCFDPKQDRERRLEYKAFCWKVLTEALKCVD